MIRRLVRCPSRLEEFGQLPQGIGPIEQWATASDASEAFECSIRAHTEVHEDRWRAEDRHVRSVGHPATAWGEHHVSEILELLGELVLQLTEAGLAALAEDLNDGHPLPPLDLRVEVEEGAAQLLGHERSDRRLARSGQSTVGAL